MSFTAKLAKFFLRNVAVTAPSAISQRGISGTVSSFSASLRAVATASIADCSKSASSSPRRLLARQQQLRQQSTGKTPSVSSKVVGGPLDKKAEKSWFEEDAEKLCKYVCINYMADAKEPGPPIKPDSEYPSWLFEMQIDPLKLVEDMDPENDGWDYYVQVRKRNLAQAKRMKRLTRKFIHLQHPEYVEKYRNRIRPSKFN